jgi:hypothetical protein
MQNSDINHTLESMIALVATSLLLKGLERCSERCCPASDIQQVVQEVEAQVEEAENDIIKEFDDDNITVYNLPVKTKLANHEPNPVHFTLKLDAKSATI